MAVITADVIRDLISGYETNRPRSLQTQVGPSNLSTPCDRRLGYQLLGVPPVASQPPSLYAFVGSAIHTRMEQVLDANPDWHTEIPVAIPVTDTVTLPGHVDAYHAPSGTVIDWKGTGPSALARYRRATPTNYRRQVNLYGLGLTLAGYEVRRVGIAFLPRNGMLADIHVVTWDWDQADAEASIRRYEALLTATGAGPAVLPLLPTAHDCNWCSWWIPGMPDLMQGCPGHQGDESDA